MDTLRERLSEGMHRLNGQYAAWFNRRHQRRGHLFENRYSAWVVLDEQHFEATLAYVLDNRRRAGLCHDQADWPWSGLGGPELYRVASAGPHDTSGDISPVCPFSRR